ncbi:autism susceptibility gene 2 protein isoform X4 [Hoplias malabaricus]|uniref:autism susceptibility gene 2 protein isoform X4 n=1 Tax=Hoplias malabaricus TaxID=27720 RepID=UPI003461D784
MEIRPKQTRRSRSLRARAMRDPSASSGSEREQEKRAPGHKRVKRRGQKRAARKAPHPPLPLHQHHHPRRKRQESPSLDDEENDEEDIIDGFAITSFFSLERLEQRNGVKLPGGKERWETTGEKRQKEEEEKEEEVTPDLDDSVFGDLPNLERTQERVKERLLKRTYSKKNKRFKSVLVPGGRTVPGLNFLDLNSANHSSSKDRLSESSAHSLSGRGYSCDSESDNDDKASDVGSVKLFSPPAAKGVLTNESVESRTCGSAKVSGLQRSQEQSSDVSFFPAVPSPTPCTTPTGCPAPSAPSPPKHSPKPTLSIKKEVTPSDPSPQLLRIQSNIAELRAPPPGHHSQPIISHHHPLPYSLHDISSPSSLPPKHHLPPSPHHLSLPTPAPPPPLPLSIPSPPYSLRTSSHFPRHSAMFASPAALAPPTLPPNSIVVPGHAASGPYADTSLLISFNQPIMYCQPHSGILIGTLSQATLLPPPMSPHVENPHNLSWRNREGQFDKYAPKLDNPFLRQSSFFSSYPPAMPGMPPLLPHPGPFSSLQGAFQPKASNPIDVAARPGAVPHTLLQKDPRVTDPFRTSKPGKWCAVHVQIAWQIYHHQQKMKQMQLDPHKLDINGKLDLFSRPPAPGVFPGFPYPHDLARPLFSSTVGAGHPAASPYGPVPHHSGFLPPSHLAGMHAFTRPGSFGGLSNLSASAFGGLANPSLGANSVFGPKEGPALPGFSPHHDAWNRLHRTPPSFPTPPAWPKPSEPERSSSANSHEREREKEREREREKRDSSLSKDEKDKDRDSVDRNRHSNHSSPASAPISYQISNLIRSSSLGSAPRGDSEKDGALMADVKVKESRSPGKDSMERSASSADSCKPFRRTPSPYSKNILNETGVKMGVLMKEGDRERERERKESLSLVKNDMKIKEERKEDQDVVVVGSEPGHQAPQAPPLLHTHTHTHPHALNLPHLHHHPHPHLNTAPPNTSHPAISLSQPSIAPPPSPQRNDLPNAASLHGVPMPHSLPFPMSAMHQMGSLNVLDRARMAPFMNVNPLAAGRERLPHPFTSWDPLREAYRNLDFQRRMDFPGHRFPSVYDPERAYRDRESHDYSHQDHLLEIRREQERLRQQAEERERLHLREELDRARIHQLHQSPIEGNLPHIPPFISHIGGIPYPRLSPSAALARTPPTAALSAPPPLVPAGPSIPRTSSPRRTTPLSAQEPREYSPSRNPKEVEAR